MALASRGVGPVEVVAAVRLGCSGQAEAGLDPMKTWGPARFGTGPDRLTCSSNVRLADQLPADRAQPAESGRLNQR